MGNIRMTKDEVKIREIKKKKHFYTIIRNYSIRAEL